MTRFKGKKITSIITTMMLAGALMASVGTVAAAEARASSSYDFSFETHAYYDDNYDISEFYSKSTTSKIYVDVKGYTGPMDIRAVGATSGGSVSSYSDCSNNHVYRVSGTGVYQLTNYVKEWNYGYAGIKGTAVEDGYTVVKGIFIPDI